MKLTIITLITLLSISYNSNAQGYIYENNKKFKTQESWIFKDNCGQGKLTITVGRHEMEDTGIILLEYWYPLESQLSSTISIFLDNGDLIVLNGRGYNDFVDSTNSSTYTLNESDVRLMSTYKIMKVRYSHGKGYNKKNCSGTNEKTLYTISNESDLIDTTGAFNFLW